jgi:hypothetical protein
MPQQISYPDLIGVSSFYRAWQNPKNYIDLDYPNKSGNDIEQALLQMSYPDYSGYANSVHTCNNV